MRLCECCKTADISHRHHRARYCLACRNGGLVGQSRRFAVRQVNHMVKFGKLPKATSFACVDCGEPATCWEHRDYAKPLDVEPVCGDCNRKRGPAANNFHAPAVSA